jgi:serine protease inhibitor
MQVMMMETTDNFNVSVRTAATVVELNYGDGNTMAAYIVLPKISVDVGSAMNQIIGTSETWEKVVDYMTWEKVNLFLPKMKKVTELSLNEPLQKMEMSTVFSSKASLNRLIDEDAYLEKALQVCAIEMTEVGMKVAVATKMKSGSRGTGGFRQTDPIVVRVDRPFGIVIMQKDLKVILFAGIIKKPEMIEE